MNDIVLLQEDFNIVFNLTTSGINPTKPGVDWYGRTYLYEIEPTPSPQRQQAIAREMSYLGTSAVQEMLSLQSECALLGHRGNVHSGHRPKCKYCRSRL
jgi:hypothetical protein